MKITAGLVIAILFAGCSNSGKPKVVHEALDFAEIYKDSTEVVLLGFKTITMKESFLFYSKLGSVTVIAPDSLEEIKTPFVTYTPNGSNQITSILIEIGSQEEMHRWRNAIKQGESRVLYPLFEFKEDEVKK